MEQKDEDLRNLEECMVAYLGKKHTTVEAEAVQPEYEPEEQVRATITYGTQPRITISPLIARWRLQDAKSRGNVFEVLGKAVLQHYEAAAAGEFDSPMDRLQTTKQGGKKE